MSLSRRLAYSTIIMIMALGVLGLPLMPVQAACPATSTNQEGSRRITADESAFSRPEQLPVHR